MSAYGSDRDNAFAQKLADATSDFIVRFNSIFPHPNQRITIFLFPGGMGSELVRANKPFPAAPTFASFWLQCSIFFGDVIYMQMNGSIDSQKRIMIADGCIDFLSLRPYADFKDWCQKNSIDLFIFGWDWRRSSAEAACFFLDRFLPAFEKQTANCKPHPLCNFVLIGHSFGGMVVKAILHRTRNRFVRQMRSAITVGTAFYGYGGQLHQFFKGARDLNWTLGTTGASQITRIISSLPGAYELLFLDEATYNSNQQAFQSDQDNFNLNQYPSVDAAAPSVHADPYNPTPGAGGLVRYSPNYGFDPNLLANGLRVIQRLGNPLPSTVAPKFFNIRAVQVKNDKVINNTVVSQSWRRIPQSFNPDQDSDPIKDDPLGPGDGTLPAWSTRLLQLQQFQNPRHVITLKGNFEHMNLMNEPVVQNTIAALL